MNEDFLLVPAIDLKGGKCVRLREGDAARTTEYSDDPLAMALEWQEQGAPLLHLVDLDGAFRGESAHLDIAQAIFQALKIPVQFGGGVRSSDQVERLFDLGAARVILGTIAVERPEVVEDAVRRHSEAIVVGIDARSGKVVVRGWAREMEITAVDLAKKMRNLGVPRVIYTDVARDGMLCGTNVEETVRVCSDSGMKVIASGGVAGIDDIRRLWEARAAGIEGVILGRALYDRKLDFREAQKFVLGMRNS